MDTNFEDVLNECIERIAGGESPADVLRAFPAHAPRLQPMLDAARLLSTAPVGEAAPQARAAAQQQMLAAVHAARSGAPAAGMFSSLWKQPAFRAAAVAGGIALFGAAGVGASAATGTAPAPVREFFGIHEDDPTATPTIGADDDDTTATPDADLTPASTPDDDDGDDDHSGPGGGDGDGGDDDSSSGDDTPEADDGEDDDSGSGSEDATKTAEPDDDHVDDATKTPEPDDDHEDDDATKTPEPDDDSADDGHEDDTPAA